MRDKGSEELENKNRHTFVSGPGGTVDHHHRTAARNFFWKRDSWRCNCHADTGSLRNFSGRDGRSDESSSARPHRRAQVEATLERSAKLRCEKIRHKSSSGSRRRLQAISM